MFQNSYNRHSYETCDGLFRQIAYVELRIPEQVIGGPSRRLVDMLDDDSTGTINNNTNTTASNLFGNSTSGNIVDVNSTESRIVPTVFEVKGRSSD